MTRNSWLAAAALVAFVAPAAANARDNHPLWRIEGKHNTVYLLGSIHVLRPQDGGLPKVADAAYDDAESLLMEIDLDDPLIGDPMHLLEWMQRMALLPQGKTLRGVLGEDYAPAQQYARKLGLDLALFDGFAPWFVATLLMQADLTKRGFDPELGIEQRLVERAAGDGKPIYGLETPEQQFAVLAGLTMNQQREFLRMTIEDADELDSEIESLVAAWRNGDTAAMSRLLADAYEEFPDLYGPLTEGRNRQWAKRIADLLDDDEDYLIVVGALHLVGPHSVIELLQERGIEVSQN